MSNADDHIGQFSEELKRIQDLAQRSNNSFPFVRANSIDKVDIIGWLAGSKADSKCYWKSRDGNFELGGIGAAYSVSDNTGRASSARVVDILGTQPDSDLILIEARRFYYKPRRDNIWKHFPDRLCFIPERMIIRRGNEYKAVDCVQVLPDTDLSDLTAKFERSHDRQIIGEISESELNIASPVSKKHFPDYDLWRKNIELSLKAIASGEIEKVVMARRTDYKFTKEVDPLKLLSGLERVNPRCYATLYQPRPGTAFISLTPERLYRRIGNKLEVEAMSSTMRRGNTPEEDRRMAHELFANDKLRREQRHVVDGSIAALSSIADGDINRGETSVLKLERIQHLVTPLTASLRYGVADDDIIQALHPTPAVGGLPRDRAVDMIYDRESFDRGWYASPIGYVSDRQSEFAVGIRSMLMKGKTVSVFTGAGIVAGSDPESEWREINSKDILLPILNGVTAQ